MFGGEGVDTRNAGEDSAQYASIPAPEGAGRPATEPLPLTQPVSRPTFDLTQGEQGHEVIGDLYFISMAARELGMHPQTLRKYERLGLVQPSRTIGSVRVYSREELERLRLIKHLVDEVGINLAGVQRLLEVAEVVRRLQRLTRDSGMDRPETRRRLAQELDELSDILGL